MISRRTVRKEMIRYCLKKKLKKKSRSIMCRMITSDRKEATDTNNDTLSEKEIKEKININNVQNDIKSDRKRTNSSNDTFSKEIKEAIDIDNIQKDKLRKKKSN